MYLYIRGTDGGFSSPFTSERKSIDVVKLVLINGKTTMVNIIDIFKIYVISNLLRYIASFILIT